MSVLTGVLFTLVPSLIASRRDPALLLRTSGRGRTALGRSLRVMVGGQLGVATALLCAAVLLTRSMRELNAVSPGLATDARITLDLRLPLADYQNGARIIAFHQLARERLSALPGIERVAFMPGLPLRDAPRREGIRRDDASDPDDRVPVLVQMGSAGILGVLGAQLLYGRDLNEFDRDGKYARRADQPLRRRCTLAGPVRAGPRTARHLPHAGLRTYDRRRCVRGCANREPGDAHVA